MKLSHHRQQQLIACCALLAILLLFVAPEISRALMGPQMMLPHSGPTTQQAMSSSAIVIAHPSSVDHQQRDMDMMPGDIFCGYCDLLIHLPLMIWLFVPQTWLLLLLRQCPQPPETPAPLPPPYSLSHPPRGPPGQRCF